jgi:two-component system, NarL family, invasion response regulator UvrY
MSTAKKPALRVLITEDHGSTRLGIRQILSEEFHPVAFGEASDGRETIVMLEKRGWDLLILDLSLPGQHGMEVLQAVKRLRPLLPVLIYSAHPEDQFALFALRAGAAGYLTKERAPEDLAAAVRKVLAGDRYMSPAAAAQLAEEPASRSAGMPHEALSGRELQVLRLTAAGQTGKAIAEALGVSQKTVSTYRRRLLKKLRVTSTADLVRYAEGCGLV